MPGTCQGCSQRGSDDLPQRVIGPHNLEQPCDRTKGKGQGYVLPPQLPTPVWLLSELPAVIDMTYTTYML